MSLFPERLREAMDDQGIKQVELAEKLDSVQSYISQILSGKKMPSDRMVKDMADILGLNLEWLLNGTGPKKPDLSREEEMSEIISKVLSQKDNSFVKQAIKTLTSLTYEEMQVLEKVVNSLAKKKD